MSTHHEQQVLLGARIPVNLKDVLSHYCENHGVRMNYFVTAAIKEKLLEIAEDAEDIAVSKDRLKHDTFISQTEMARYFKKRGLKA